MASLPTPRGTVTAHPHDQRFTRLKPVVLRASHYACWLCGHGGNMQTLGIDHVVPLAECGVQGISPYDLSNLKAAHVKPCTVCSAAAGRAIRCNAIRGALSPERCRQILADRCGVPVLGTWPSSVAPAARRPATGEREW